MKTKVTSLVLAMIMLVSIFVPSMSASAASNVYTSQANEGTYVVANMSEYSCGVSVRSTPSYDYASIGTINANTAYKYLNSKSTDSHGREWYKIQYTSSKTGWVCSHYTHLVTVSAKNYVLTTSSKINMRKGPGTSYASYGLSYANTYYSVIGCAGEGFSLNGTKWYQVMDNQNRVFWFKSTLLSKVNIGSTVTCDVNTGTYFSQTYRFKAASYARTGPGTSYGKVRSTAFGTSCTVEITGVKLNTSKQLWYSVIIRDSGKTYSGYVLSSLIK